MLTYYISASKVSDKKSAHFFNWEGLVCYESLLSCYCQDSLFVFGKLDYNVSRCGSLWVHLTGNLLSFLDVYIHVFHQIGVFSAIISSNILCTPFSSASGTPMMSILVFLTMSQRPLRLCPLFSNLFFPLFLRLNNFHSPNSQFTDSFDYSNLPLATSIAMCCLMMVIHSEKCFIH